MDRDNGLKSEERENAAKMALSVRNSDTNTNKQGQTLSKMASRDAEMMSHFSTEESARIRQLFDDNHILVVVGEGTKKTRALKRETFDGLMHSMFEINHLPTLEGLFRAFNIQSANFVERSEWIRGLSIMTRGSFEERIEFAFKVYDMDEDGELEREEMYLFLRDAIVVPKNEDDMQEEINDLIEILFRQLDGTCDGVVDKSDFAAAVRQQPALLECLGQIFPSVKNCEVFETVIGNETKTILN